MRPVGRLTGCRGRQQGKCHKGEGCHGDVTGDEMSGGAAVRYGMDAVGSVRGRSVTSVARWNASGSVRSTADEIKKMHVNGVRGGSVVWRPGMVKRNLRIQLGVKLLRALVPDQVERDRLG